MAYWYVAHSDELLLDLDDYMRPTKNGCPWGEAFFRRRLRDAMLSGKLNVERVFLLRSASERHYHAIVKLAQRYPLYSRLCWQMHLGSDLYRARCDMMRAVRAFEWPSLLILREQVEGYRYADYVCACTEKHDTQKQFDLGQNACPTWQRLRGMSPYELFGVPSKLNERFQALPIGEVPLSLILTLEGVPK
jgi:hypothetical protein